MEPKLTRPILRYHGGKWRLAPWIIQNLPPHRIYVEPYGGGGSVLLRKARSYSELYNDLSGQVVNVFRVLRDPTQARELARLIELTPYSRTEFEASYTTAGDPIEQARRTLCRAFMGFGSASVNPEHSTGFRANANRSGTTPAQDWANYPALIPSFVQRLRGVCIEQRPALEVIAQHDDAGALFYVDPPYTRDSRARSYRDCYEFEMSDDDHRELAARLHQVKGMVVLSGYASALYDQELFPDWHRIERPTHGDSATDRIEVLWFNPAAARHQPASLFDLAA